MVSGDRIQDTGDRIQETGYRRQILDLWADGDPGERDKIRQKIWGGRMIAPAA